MAVHDTGALVEKLSCLAKRDLARCIDHARRGLCLPGVLRPRTGADLRQGMALAGRAGSIPQPGDYLTWRIGAQPVAVVRQKDGSLMAFSNVCRHRMMRLLSGSGRCRRIVCPYHAWTYDLDGRLLEARHMDRTRSFDASAVSLPSDTLRGLAGMDLRHAECPAFRRLRRGLRDSTT